MAWLGLLGLTGFLSLLGSLGLLVLLGLLGLFSVLALLDLVCLEMNRDRMPNYIELKWVPITGPRLKNMLNSSNLECTFQHVVFVDRH